MADSTPQKVMIFPLKDWTARIAAHLGGALSGPELDTLFQEFEHGFVQLWGIGNPDHIATIATRFEAAYDGSKQLAMIHSGGEIMPHLGELDSYFTALAWTRGCARIVITSADPYIARAIRKALGFELYEVAIARRVTAPQEIAA